MDVAIILAQIATGKKRVFDYLFKILSFYFVRPPHSQTIKSVTNSHQSRAYKNIKGIFIALTAGMIGHLQYIAVHEINSPTSNACEDGYGYSTRRGVRYVLDRSKVGVGLS